MRRFKMAVKNCILCIWICIACVHMHGDILMEVEKEEHANDVSKPDTDVTTKNLLLSSSRKKGAKNVYQQKPKSNSSRENKQNGAVSFVAGMVSLDCLRCICLTVSSCEQIGCRGVTGYKACGYFQISEMYFDDCKEPNIVSDYDSCTRDVMCASQCIQNYMKKYAERYHCPLTCEGFSREHSGGPNGCNKPHTNWFWKKLQEQPGCKGVE